MIVNNNDELWLIIINDDELRWRDINRKIDKVILSYVIKI